jgi:SIR2-like domain
MNSTLQFTNIGGTRFVKDGAPKEVYVLGAGVSMPAGLPAATTLWREASLWNKARPAPFKTNFLDELTAYFYPSLSQSRAEYPDVEDMLGMIQAAEEYDHIRGNGRGYRWRTGLLEIAKRQLTYLIGQFLWSFQNDGTGLKIAYLRRIVSLRTSNVVYVSFNYDLLLETALTLEGVPFTYAIDRERPGSVIVLKPHGSINWFYESPNMKGRAWIENNCHHYFGKFYATNLLKNPFEGSKINLDFAIIAPFPYKQIPQEFLKRIWTSFSSSIHSARKVTIVGYSMPNADRISRIVMRRAGSKHSTNKRVIVINPDLRLKKHFEDFVTERAIFHERKCDEFF